MLTAHPKQKDINTLYLSFGSYNKTFLKYYKLPWYIFLINVNDLIQPNTIAFQ